MLQNGVPLTPDQEANTLVADLLRRFSTMVYRHEGFLDSLTALPGNNPDTREERTNLSVQLTLYSLKKLQTLIEERYPTAVDYTVPPLSLLEVRPSS